MENFTHLISIYSKHIESLNVTSLSSARFIDAFNALAGLGGVGLGPNMCIVFGSFIAGLIGTISLELIELSDIAIIIFEEKL